MKAKLTPYTLVRVENANLGNFSWSPRATSLWPGRIRWSLGFAAARRVGSEGTRNSEFPESVSCGADLRVRNGSEPRSQATTLRHRPP